ncbi:ABC-three component system protein [Cryobacterium sp. Y57]|uniref:ABC-three component system protein n=1 Tax=Cryobacterium sp. Y57 TaxID=2048287 RepID=UPI0011B0072B|nr:ABC-three component system protein [Cryobacterium sp. Y57]
MTGIAARANWVLWGVAYAYEDLNEAQFEALVVQAAKLRLGKGVQGFAAGVDGGRDARFEGLADGFPSWARPWDKITIIQAKHTNSYGYFSDPDFGGTSETAVLTLELPRAKKLHVDGKLENYLFYSNRYLTANANESLLNRISREIGIARENVHLCGIEALDEAFREEPRLAQLAGVNPVDGPLIVSSRELAEVVEAVAAAIDRSGSGTGVSKGPQERTSLVEKNVLNSMTGNTSKRLMRNYGHLLRQIKTFLADPANARIRAIYDDCAEDFHFKIVAHREEHQTFDKVFSYLVDLLISRDSLLGRNRSLTRGVVFYMYWNCDIGEIAKEIEIEVSSALSQ